MDSSQARHAPVAQQRGQRVATVSMVTSPPATVYLAHAGVGSAALLCCTSRTRRPLSSASTPLCKAHTAYESL